MSPSDLALSNDEAIACAYLLTRSDQVNAGLASHSALSLLDKLGQAPRADRCLLCTQCGLLV